MTITAHTDWEFDRPLVLVGFPSHGLVGAIAASYLIPRLEMTLVATMQSNNLPPVASIRDGRGMSPVQFFATERECGPGGECDQVVVIRSDAAPPPEHAAEVAAEILSWAETVGAEMVVTLEGSAGDDGDETVYGVPNLIGGLEVATVGAAPHPDGAMGGLSASLLSQGNTRNMSVLCLFTQASEKMPDAAAAARLVEVADAVVPGIKMEPDPLREQAEKMEASLRANIQQQQKAMEKMGEHRSNIMYR